MSQSAPVDWLLALWREARHPSTSALLARIAGGLNVEVSRLPAKKTDAARAWLRSVRAEPAFLLSARLAQLEVFCRTTSATLIWPLFEALATLPPDPRIATLATRILVRELEVELTAKLTRRLLDCVERHGDDAHFVALEQGLSLVLLGDGLAARAVRVMQQGLAARPQGLPLPAAEQRRLAATPWELPDISPVASLYAPVWAAPREPGRKQVLSDQLLERGEPRGEFIALQLAQASPRRQRALLKAHGRTWLGALADVVDLKSHPPRFEDGFVTEVWVRPVKRAPFLLAADAPEWATVRRVRSGLQRFTRAMVGLEDAGPVSLAALEGLAREALPLGLRSVSLAALPGPTVEVLRQLAAPPRWLGLHFGVYEPTRELRDSLPRLAELDGLERLRLSAHGREVAAALVGQMGLSWLPPALTRLELRDEERFVVLHKQPQGWSLGLVDLHPSTRMTAGWRAMLSNLSALSWREVHLSVVGGEDDEGVQALVAHLAQRFQRPVPVQALDEVPLELAW